MRNIFTWRSNTQYAINVQNNHRQRQYTNWYICESRLLCLSLTPTAAIFIGYLQFLQNELPHLLEDMFLKIQLSFFLQLEDFPTITMHEKLISIIAFLGRWISHGSPHQRPPGSPDFNRLSFCPWGYIKELVCPQKWKKKDTLPLLVWLLQP